MNGLVIDIAVEAGDWPAKAELEGVVSRTVMAALDHQSIQVADSELSVLFTDDAAIRKLNAGWRDKDKATNVLSFPAIEIRKGDPLPPLLGDIVLACETIAREAVEEDKRFVDHLHHLILHGLLHLLGYDHETDGDAEEMEDLERRILEKLAIPDPYR